MRFLIRAILFPEVLAAQSISFLSVKDGMNGFKLYINSVIIHPLFTLLAELDSHCVGSRSKNIWRCLSSSSRNCWITWSLDLRWLWRGWSVDRRKREDQILGSVEEKSSSAAPWSRWNMTWPALISNCDFLTSQRQAPPPSAYPGPSHLLEASTAFSPAPDSFFGFVTRLPHRRFTHGMTCAEVTFIPHRKDTKNQALFTRKQSTYPFTVSLENSACLTRI